MRPNLYVDLFKELRKENVVVNRIHVILYHSTTWILLFLDMKKGAWSQISLLSALCLL